jgi:hypothetical protein
MRAERLGFKNSRLIVLRGKESTGAEILIRSYLKASGFRILEGKSRRKYLCSEGNKFVIFRVYAEGFEDFNREARILRRMGVSRKDIMAASLIIGGGSFG